MRKKKIEALVWDFGQVAFFFPKQTWLTAWLCVPRVRDAVADVNDAEIEHAVLASQMRFETGQIVLNEHRLALSEIFGLKPSLTWKEFFLGYLQAKDVTLNTPLFAAQKLIAAAGIQQAVISNLCPVWHQVLTSAGATHHLDVQLYSYIEGIAKPSEELIVRAIDRLGVAAEDIAVIDDCAANLEAASACGAATHLFRNNRELAAWLAGCDFAGECWHPLIFQGEPEPFTPVWKREK